jgi:hypothetical protein
MYKFLAGCCFLLISQTSTAQLSVKVFNYRPTGDFGFVFKPTFSAEVGYMGLFEDGNRWRSQASVTFIVLKPRLETIPTSGLLSDGTGKHVLPGAMSYKKYNLAQAFVGVDYAFVCKQNFFVFAGLDLTAGGTFVEYTDDVETLKTESYTGGGILAGFRFRLGAEYTLSDEISLLIHIQRCGWIVTDPASLNAANDYGLGIKYNFQ